MTQLRRRGSWVAPAIGRGRILVKRCSHRDYPRETGTQSDFSEALSQEAAQGRWLKVLDVLRIVAPAPDVLPSAHVAEPEEGLPRDGHDAAFATDTAELSHGTLGRLEVLENFETRDDIDTVVAEWQHSRVCSDSGRRRKSL